MLLPLLVLVPWTEAGSRCRDVFEIGLTKLSGSLVKDYRACRKDLPGNVTRRLDLEFSDILRFFSDGNGTKPMDSKSIFSCKKVSHHELTVLCSKYGLSQEQLSVGFPRHLHADKWVQEESLDELNLTCDRVFSEGVETTAYSDPVAAFAECTRRYAIDPAKRDRFEKKNALELMAYRAKNASRTPVDFRGYVACRNLRAFRINGKAIGPSWSARESCANKSLTYSELLMEPGDDDRERYIDCRDVFNEALERLSSGLLADFADCVKAGKIDRGSRTRIETKFKRIFDSVKSKNFTLDHANSVSCRNFDNSALADLCRLRGRGAKSVGDPGDDWLNSEDLDELYLRCDDLFNGYMQHLNRVPLEQFLSCKWVGGLGDRARRYIDERIRVDYENKHN